MPCDDITIYWIAKLKIACDFSLERRVTSRIFWVNPIPEHWARFRSTSMNVRTNIQNMQQLLQLYIITIENKKF